MNDDQIAAEVQPWHPMYILCMQGHPFCFRFAPSDSGLHCQSALQVHPMTFCLVSSEFVVHKVLSDCFSTIGIMMMNYAAAPT